MGRCLCAGAGDLAVSAVEDVGELPKDCGSEGEWAEGAVGTFTEDRDAGA